MKQYAVIGDPISHSLSPLLHNEIYSQIGTLISYKKQQITKSGLSSFVSNNHIKYYNVTIPHKESILPYLKSLDNIASEIGAVNCVMDQKGFNTDWLGFKYAMINNDVDIKDKNCLIIGAGGAAKAIAYTLIQSKAKSINIFNRSNNKKRNLDNWINSYGIKNNIIEIPDLIINCTPIGMWPKIELLPFNIKEIHKHQIIIDTIYNPIETKWMELCRKKGAHTIGGLDMFIYQGLASAEIWENDNIINRIQFKQIKKVLKSELC
tara:strand:- start:308 stop:1099 length:792 start_codon:yes stop_codon:yes gene_type:complete